MLGSTKQDASLDTYHRFEACNTEFPTRRPQVLCATKGTSPQVRAVNRDFTCVGFTRTSR